MTDVEFNEEQDITINRPNKSANSKMARSLISLGIVSNETQATVVMLALSIIFLASAILIIVYR